MPPNLRTLIQSGGPAHDYERTSAMLAEALAATGRIEAEITSDLAALDAETLARFDVLTLHCALWSEVGVELGRAQTEAILEFLERGGGLVLSHAAVISFDTWGEFPRIAGGTWEWGKSGHGPYCPEVEVHTVDPAHPITQGIGDFTIHDELYHTLTITEHVHALLTSLYKGALQPMAWTHTYGPARVHYNALGHGVETWQSPQLRQLIARGVLWAGKAL